MAGRDISGLVCEEGCYADTWTGTAEQLLMAGVITRDTLPGEPGNNKFSATYFDGKLVKRGSSYPCNENYLRITRYGRFLFVVRKGISKEEKRRRNTKEILAKKSPDTDFCSIAPALFYIGEKVVVDHACVKVVDIRYDNDDGYIGYVYKVDPNLDDKYSWFVEKLIYKYIAKPASVISLPSAALEPVRQTRGPGRLPKSIASFWDAEYKRIRRNEELSKLREKLRSLSWRVDASEKTLRDEQAHLIAVKKQILELTR